MPNPYTSQAISGYNVTPPSDDGAAISANALKWATHKDKLADPIKTLAEAINTEALAAFGKILGADVVTQSGNYTVTAANIGRFIEMTGAGTVSLLPAGTAGSGFALVVVNISSSAVVTVDGNASETINGSPSVNLYPGEGVLLTTDGSSWTAIGATPERSVLRTVKAADEAKPSDDTLADDTELAGIPLVNNVWYQIELSLEGTQNGGDLTWDIVWSNTPADVGSGIWTAADSGVGIVGNKATLNSATIMQGTNQLTDASTFNIHLVGQFLANATTGGTVSLQWAQSTSNSSPTTIRAGSWMRVSELSQ
jgi:hypothetical protein